MKSRLLCAPIVALLAAGSGPPTAWCSPAAPAEHPAAQLIERGVVAMRIDPEKSRRDAEEALRLLADRPDADLEIRARLVLCDYQAERDTAAAAGQIAAATRLLPRAHRIGLKAGVLDCRGEISETAGENTTARAFYDDAVTVATDTHDDEMLAQSLFLRGYLQGLQGDYATGLLDLKRAQALFDKLGKPVHALTTLNSIAILYNRMGDFAQARHIYSRALQAQHQAGMQREELVTLHNLGRAYENLHQWEDARKAFAQSLVLARQLNYARGEAYALRGLAAAANGTGDPRNAIELLARAETLQKQTPDARLGAQIQLARGIALHQMGRNRESIAMLEEALGIFLQADAMGELNATYAELAKVYADSGEWRSAYERQKQAAQVADRLAKNQQDQRFAAVKVEFDTAAKEKENAALLRENQISQKALARDHDVRSLQAIVILLSALLVLILATLAIFQYRSTRHMRSLAMTDELTQAPNRRSVLSKLEPLLDDAQAAPCSILIIDIDHFKRINDQYGHPAGDEVLKDVAEAVRAGVRQPAFFGRLGGEEFLIVLPETSLQQARATAERFRQRIISLDTSRWLSEAYCITASIGCAVSVPGADTPSTMLKRADLALYEAKRAGRNCIRSEPPEPAEQLPLAEAT